MSQVQADLSNSCLTVEADPKTRNCWELRMLEENRIEGLLPLSVCDDNGVLRLSYDTAGTEPLSLYTDTAQLKAADLRRLILTLKHVITGMKPFLLEPAGIVLSPESVCLDLRSHSPRFLYLPCRKTVLSEELSQFLQLLMAGTDHDDYPGMVLAYRLYRESLDHPNALDRLEQILISQEDSLLTPLQEGTAAAAGDPGGAPYVKEDLFHARSAFDAGGVLPEGAVPGASVVPESSPSGESALPEATGASHPVVLEVRETRALPEEQERGAGLFRRLFKGRG